MDDLLLILSYLTWSVCLVNLLASLLGYLSGWNWIFELFSHFRVQYAIALVVCDVAFLLLRDNTGAALSAAGVLLNLSLILPLYQGRPARASQASTYRVLSANVYQPNRHYDRLIKLVQVLRPDFISLVEVNQGWIDQLQPLLTDYPYLAHSLREDNYGLALFSRYPFRCTETLYFGEAGVPTLLAELDLGGKLLTSITTHPPPPKGAANTRFRNLQMADIASFTASCTNPVMVMGDLNLTSWSVYFQRLLKNGHLLDSRQGLGVQASWPVQMPIFLIPLDHILVSSGIGVYKRKIESNIGSDHYPVLLEFSL